MVPGPLGLSSLVGGLPRPLPGAYPSFSSSSPLAGFVVVGAPQYRLPKPVGSGPTSPCILNCGRPFIGPLIPRSGRLLMYGPVELPVVPWL
jgi:hypothetical protein